MDATSPKLLDHVRETLRTKYYSYRTEQAYVDWIKRFIMFHHKRHPKELGAEEVQTYISHLANGRQAAAFTQNQAISAILFLYKYVFQKELILASDILRPGHPEHLPIVLSHPEALAVIGKMKGNPKLIVQLLYGSGLRVSECLRLRVKDLDFAHHQLIVRDGKGEKKPPHRVARFSGRKPQRPD